jgi:hypothetical protein
MSAGEYHTNWWPTAATSSTFPASYTVMPYNTYQPPAYPAPLQAEGWRCPDCTLVMAPWVPYHQCDTDARPGPLNKAEDGDGVTG